MAKIPKKVVPPDSSTPIVEEQSIDTAAQNITLEDVASGFIADMPDVMPHVETPRLADTLPNSAAPPAAGIKDASGTVFDANYHAVDASGNPKRTKTGNFRKKTGAIPGNLAPGATIAETVVGVDPAKCKAFAQQMVFMLEFAAVQLSGPNLADEWEMTSGEKSALEEAGTNYAVARGLSDIPPGMALVMAVGFYILPRFMPGKKTQAAFKAKVESLTPKARRKKQEELMQAALKESENAYSNSGIDGNRQEYGGQNDSLGIH